MDQQTINNKLIAEFDKLEQVDYGDNTILYIREGNLGYRPENLKYHTNWNWLMPVVAKIRRICYSEELQMHYAAREMVAGLCRVDIKAVHEFAAEFIIWYNKKRK